MSNNLRQIAKDLRSFVKRCKDVHYSDSLLITFLVTGLLTFVPRTLIADVVTEQQEVTAQTYDAITDLRQSFIRARKENEQSLKGAERELAMLLQQGEQVIKSPWASFQFGTGYTNNDWGTTYRGRGGKFLEYYRRDNDLTKYVFDASKHLYGATNLNIPRNQEPNSLTINPANVHEPYKPYVPERMDNINMPNPVSYNPVVYVSTPVSTTTTTYTFSDSRTPTTPGLGGAGNTRWGNFGGVVDTTGAPYSPDYTFSSTNYKSYNGWDSNTVSYKNNSGSVDYRNEPNVTAAISKIGGSGWGSMATMWNGRDYSNSTDLNDIRETNWSWWYNPTSSWSSSVQYENLNGSTTSSITYGTDDTAAYYTPGPYWNSPTYASNNTVGYDYIYARGNTGWTSPFTWYWHDQATTKSNAYNYYITNQGQSIYGTAYTYNNFAVVDTGIAGPSRYTLTINTVGGSRSFSASTDAGVRQQAVQKIIDDEHTARWAGRYNAYTNFGSGYTGTGGYRETLIYAPSNIDINYTNAHIGDNHPGGSFAFIGALSGGSAVTANMNATIVRLKNGATKGNAAYVISTSGGNKTLTFDNGSYIEGHNNDIGFNIQAREWAPTVDVSIKGNADITFTGSNNSVFKLNSHINKFW